MDLARSELDIVLWGALNGLYRHFSCGYEQVEHRNRGERKDLQTFKSFDMLSTFGLAVLAWVFRAENLGHAFQIYSGILTYPYFRSRQKCLASCR